jgi:hypothetical protein
MRDYASALPLFGSLLPTISQGLEPKLLSMTQCSSRLLVLGSQAIMIIAVVVSS